MGFLEWNLAAAMLAGFGYLLVRNRRRMARRGRQAEAMGLTYHGRGLSHLPTQLADSVLFAISDGGHERDVMAGERVLAGETVTVTQFDLDFLRDVRGEWAFLDTDPPFRVVGPTTVLVYELPRALPRCLLKRRGPAEIIADEPLEVYKSGASVAREALGIDRTRAVAPPASLGREPHDVDAIDADFLIWAASRADADALVGAPLVTLLQSDDAAAREIVVELHGPLLLLYCATDGALSPDDAITLHHLADALCTTLLTQIPPR